jgi:hypothetical protein
MHYAECRVPHVSLFGDMGFEKLNQRISATGPHRKIKLQRKATAAPSTAFVAKNAPNSAQDDSVSGVQQCIGSAKAHRKCDELFRFSS